jgi:hypothetical protein
VRARTEAQEFGSIASGRSLVGHHHHLGPIRAGQAAVGRGTEAAPAAATGAQALQIDGDLPLFRALLAGRQADHGNALGRVALRYLALSKPRKGLPWAAAAPTSWPKSAAQKETSGSRESPKEASGSRGTSRRFPTVSITVLCRRTKAGCVSRTRSSPLRFSSASRWLFWSAV